jgi:hypothetical protein
MHYKTKAKGHASTSFPFSLICFLYAMGLTKISWKRSILFSYPSCPSFISFLFLFLILCDKLVEPWRFTKFFFPSFPSFSFHSFLSYCVIANCFMGFLFFFSLCCLVQLHFFLGVFVTCCIVQCNFISFYNCVTLLVEYQNNFLVLVVLFNHYFSFFWFCGFFGAFT